MIETEINKVLAQMRSISNTISQPAQTEAAADQPNFAELMQAAVSTVNEHTSKAAQLVSDFETANTDASIAEVMVAMQKASISFQAMTEVRNKLVDAYQEIMNMPI